MNSFSGLLNNAALMLVLCVVYDTFNIHAISNRHVREITTGLIVGLIAIAVMLNPWSLEPGVFFDTRWVLLSLCGLFFGFNTTVLAIIIAGTFRLSQGGAGGIVGTLVIVTTALTGLAWRYVQQKKSKPLTAGNLYIFGVLVQLVMLSCMSFMPKDLRLPIILTVAPPVLTIYPVLTMIIGLVLRRQEERRQTDKALIREIHERKAAEQEARESQEEWESTFNSISDIVTLQDTEFRIVKINQAGQTALNAGEDQLVGRFCYEVFSHESRPCPDCPLTLTAKTLEPCAHEIENQRLGKIFLVSGAPVLDDDGRLVFLTHVAKDITEKKKLEKDLLQAQKMESIGTLAGGIAHDFNNILSAIMGYAELAKINIPQDSAAAHDIDQVIVSSKRAADLVRQILTFSRKSDHFLEPLSPHLIIKETLKMLRASLPATIQIQEDIDTQCGQIMADPTKLQQIVINLCTNALHAMENQKGVLSIRLFRNDLDKDMVSAESGETPGEYAVIEVVDTGRGMAPETVPHIFDPYFTTKQVGKGTGLGLSVIHGIVKDYYGFIRVKSQAGHGSTFQIFLPLLLDGIFPDPVKDPVSITDVSGTERLLIVDDELQLLHTGKQILERYGYRVTTISSSPRALQAICDDPFQFDLVISDQTMPELTGAELAAKILEKRPDMPIIICTGYSSVISEEDILAIGVKQYVRKPFSGRDLVSIVRQVLNTGYHGNGAKQEHTPHNPIIP